MFPSFGYNSYGFPGYLGPMWTPWDGYGTLRLTKTSPVQSWTEPLTTAQVRTFLRVEYGQEVDDEQEDELLLMITAARAAAETIQNRDLVVKQYDLTMDGFLNWRIHLRDPLASVDLVQYKNSDGTVTALVENTDYIVDAAKSIPLIEPMYNQTWPNFTPWPSSAVLIRFTSGMALDDPWWLTTGAMVRRGMLYLISAWFSQRLPWDRGIGNIAEYPMSATILLAAGASVRIP